jgi:NADPH:quinone reductase-like Zn-dependent oxidoreductase
MDAAGTVESIGAGVERLRPGDPVMAVVLPRRPEGGAQSELVVLPEASVVGAPEGVSLEQAATLPMNGLTAMRGLELLALPAGATLAVSGGAGLLASYVIPLAKRRGLRVLADAKPGDEALVRGFGADVVLPRGEQFSPAAREVVPDGVDALFDTALLGPAAFPALRDGGAMALVRTWQGGDPVRGIELRSVAVADVLDRTEWLDELRVLAGGSVLSLRVAGAFAPEQAAEAHRLMERGGLRGRALIVF